MKFNLCAGFVISLLLFTACKGDAQLHEVKPAEFESLIKDSTVQLLDVRTADEFNTDHLAHAMQADWTRKDEFARRTASLNKSKPVYLYCLSGGRSAAAAEWLNKKGYTTYNLQGGINAWKQDHKPVEQIKTATPISLAEYLSRIPMDKTVLVDIGATWCPPCKKMNPQIDSLAAVHPKEFILIKIDGGAQTELCAQLKATEFPTFIVYKGGKESWRFTGETDIKNIAAQLN